MRFQIVPARYRSFFPEKYKSHRSHDILLLCFDCNETAIKRQHIMKTELCKKYKIKGKLMDQDFMGREKLELVKRYAKVLINGEDKIPPERIDIIYQNTIEKAREVLEINILEEEDLIALKDMVENYSTADMEILRKVMKMKVMKDVENSKKKRNLHGKVLIEKMGGEDKIPELIIIWRKHFLDSMKPKFLPNNWSVHHSIERTFGKNSRFYHEEEKKTKLE